MLYSNDWMIPLNSLLLEDPRSERLGQHVDHSSSHHTVHTDQGHQGRGRWDSRELVCARERVMKMVVSHSLQDQSALGV